MPDRLDHLVDLQRQRAAAVENLARLEREIAAELERLGGKQNETTALPPSPSAPLPAPPITPPPRPAGSRAPQTLDPEAILARYRGEARSARQQVQYGCFLYFFLALLLLVGSVVAYYFVKFRS